MAPAPGGPDEAYLLRSAPAAAIPWGLLLGTAGAAPLSARPWHGLLAGLLATLVAALLGSAVHARATGWGTGAVLYVTAAYATALAGLALLAGGWTTTF